MEWKTVEGYTLPEEVDTKSSPSTVYLHKNIVEVPNVDQEGNETGGVHWKYEEAQIAKEDFAFIGQATVLANQAAMDETLAEILLNQMEV